MNSPRYFKSFYNSDPMVELTEADARERGSYVVEDSGAMRRYRRIIDNALDSIVYAGWDDPGPPLADLRQLAPGVRAEIHSPVELCDHGGNRWRTWHVSPAGTVTKILEPEFSADGKWLRENLRAPDGQLISYTVYRYATDGLLFDLVTYAPDGAVINRQDA